MDSKEKLPDRKSLAKEIAIRIATLPIDLLLRPLVNGICLIGSVGIFAYRTLSLPVTRDTLRLKTSFITVFDCAAALTLSPLQPFAKITHVFLGVIDPKNLCRPAEELGLKSQISQFYWKAAETFIQINNKEMKVSLSFAEENTQATVATMMIFWNAFGNYCWRWDNSNPKNNSLPPVDYRADRHRLALALQTFVKKWFGAGDFDIDAKQLFNATVDFIRSEIVTPRQTAIFNQMIGKDYKSEDSFSDRILHNINLINLVKKEELKCAAEYFAAFLSKLIANVKCEKFAS